MSKTLEELARLFHDTYERLAPSYGYETRTDTKSFDPTSKNGKLMIATVAAVREEMQAEVEQARQRGVREGLEQAAEIVDGFGETEISEVIRAAAE